MSQQPKDHAVVIGIDRYPDYRPAAGAIHDARAFHGWLVDSPAGGGIPESQCRLLVPTTTSPLGPGQQEIDDCLVEICRQGGRRLYLYFSGHGLSREHRGVLLCLGKWSPEWRYCALDSEDYCKTLVHCGRFEEIVCFFDCCRTPVTWGRGLFPCFTLGTTSGAPQTGTFVAYATRYTAAAYGPAERPAGNAKNGLSCFTQALLAGLCGGAGTAVTAGNLKRYLEAEVPRLAAARGLEQRPQIIYDFSSDREPVFGTPIATRIHVTFSPMRLGHRIYLLDGQLTMRYREESCGTSWDLPAEPRLHLLVDESSGEQCLIRHCPDSKGVTHVEF